MYILAISGFIQEQEQREFEQHFEQLRFVAPRENEGFYLTRDVSNDSKYHFFSLWPEKGPLEHFLASSEYHRLNGAFKTLGFISNEFIGEVSDFFKNGDSGGGPIEDIA